MTTNHAETLVDTIFETSFKNNISCTVDIYLEYPDQFPFLWCKTSTLTWDASLLRFLDHTQLNTHTHTRTHAKSRTLSRTSPKE
jgi:hypothetical protein